MEEEAAIGVGPAGAAQSGLRLYVLSEMASYLRVD